MATFADITADLERQAIELPSWAFGNSGTRFKVFAQPGVPRDPFEKVADAAQVHLHTGLAPSVALHIPWDRVDDFDKLRRYAEDLGVRLGTINTNTFQDDDYMLGSLCHVHDAIRAKALRHCLDCVDIMDVTGSRDLKIWLPDGLNYPGQADLLGRQERLADSLSHVYARLGDHQRLVLEYKLFEPAFYATDVPDWGTAYVHCAALGERAVVCLDTGHHAPSTNIEFIVMQLLRLGRLGAFDFNSRFYADDDLIVGAADPFQLFRIMFEVVRGGGFGADSEVSFMLDQCHNIEAKIPGQIRSVLNVQEMTARALLVDRAALADAERAGDVLAGNTILMDAFYTDVRADLADWRASRDLPADPLAAYNASGYQERIVAERVGGTQAGWGA
jgi:L-rhamnose isomerase / sugar isomerase